MSVVDSVFVAASETSSQVAAWLVAATGCEMMDSEADEVRLRLRGATPDEWFGVVVHPNGYTLSDPEPDEIAAMDTYGIEIQVRGGENDEALHRETGTVFGQLLDAHPDLPMLLVHNLDTLVIAHLPEVGTQTFEPPISPDADDIEIWRPWVRS